MVANVTLTEPMSNAIGAALDDRNKKLVGELVRYKAQPASADRDFTIACVEDAIRDGIAARLAIAEAYETPEYPDDMTLSRLSEADTSAIWHEYLDR